ncbi:MAG TPA: DNA replication/repair protein RecF [Microbacteriaceae bacterium]|nr:DNA replication/repair protein RecF [Microbacteriaceae bacterium]
MRVTRLSLTDFRNYRTAEISLDPGVTAFVGANGQGKTNLVEAIGFLGSLGSHRVSSNQPLIRDGADFAVVRGLVDEGGRAVLLEVQINRSGPNRARVNHSAVKPRDMLDHVTAVVFAPEDLALVRGDPAGRRDFLDGYLVRSTPRFSAVIADYDRVLRQRNSLLKSARSVRPGASHPARLTTLDIWDERLVDLGSRIIEARLDALAALAGPVRDAYRRIAGTDQRPAIVMQSSVVGEAAGPLPAAQIGHVFLRLVRESRAKELDRGVTLTGPHRDDVLLLLNDLPARNHASHGESWSLALALRLGEADRLRDRSGAAGGPIIILDDVFAELDRRRGRALAGALTGYEQVLVTAAIDDDVPDILGARVVRVTNGTVEVS